jgi:GIY-YIG catalytic domain/NUMOD3 motif
MFSQGYIGVSVNAERRWVEHLKKSDNKHLRFAIKKYGWENLIKKQILIADKDYCLDIEKKIRPTDGIGWNLVTGGGFPPIRYGNKDRLGLPSWSKGKKLSDEHRKNLSTAHMGQVAWNKGLKGAQTAWNKGKPITPNAMKALKEASKEVTCPKCGKVGPANTLKHWHFDNCIGQRNFKARVTIDGKRILIGVFSTKEEANQCAKKYYEDRGLLHLAEKIGKASNRKRKGIQ